MSMDGDRFVTRLWKARVWAFVGVLSSTKMNSVSDCMDLGGSERRAMHRGEIIDFSPQSLIVRSIKRTRLSEKRDF